MQNVLFTGGGEPGEPLMDRAVVAKGLRHARVKGLRSALYTNGLALTPNTIPAIFDAQPAFVRVSLYGGSPEGFERYTGAKASLYQRILDNLEAAARYKADTASTTRLGLTYLLHPVTIESLPTLRTTLLQKCSPHLLSQLEFVRFTVAVDYWQGPQQDSERLQEAFGFIEQQIKPILHPNTHVMLARHRLNDLNQPKPYNVCRASGWFAETAPDGRAYLCCERNFVHAYEIGDLKHQSLAEMWNGSQRLGLLDRINQSGCAGCAILCKPHEMAKVFTRIEELRAHGQMDQVEQWVRDARTLLPEAADWVGAVLGEFQA